MTNKEALSEKRFDTWLTYHKIKLQPHQYKLCLAIFKLDELSFKWEPAIEGVFNPNSTFAALGSGLSFALKTAERFIKDKGHTPNQ